MGRSREPPATGRFREVTCPTSVLSERCATTRRPSPTSRSSSRRPTTSSTPAEEARLLERHPANVVRLDKPSEQPGDEADDRYRRAARTLAGWRSDGTFRKDPHPSLYVYEQAYRVPGTDVTRTQRGFFARLRLHAFDEGAVLPARADDVRPEGGPLQAPSSDRRQHEPGRGLYDDPSGAGRRVLDAVTAPSRRCRPDRRRRRAPSTLGGRGRWRRARRPSRRSSPPPRADR